MQDGAEPNGNIENRELPTGREKGVTASAGTGCLLSPPREQMSLQPGSSQHPHPSWPHGWPEATRDRLERERPQDPSAGRGSPSTGILSLGTAQLPFPGNRSPAGAGSPARRCSGAAPRHPQDPHPAYLHPRRRPAAAPRPRYRESPDPAPPPGASRTRLRPAETAGGRARGPPKGPATPGCCIPATPPIRGTGVREPGPGLMAVPRGEGQDPSPHSQGQLLLQRGRTVCLTHG